MRIGRSVPRYLWPPERQLTGSFDGESEIQAAVQRALKPYEHLSLDDALRTIREDREKIE